MFEDCERAKEYPCRCDCLQELAYDSATIFGHVTPPGKVQEDGAAILGRVGHWLNELALGAKSFSAGEFNARQTIHWGGQ